MLAAIVQILVGLVTLLFGRRLFWLFVALAGFLFGLLLGQQIFAGQPEIVRFFLALVIGAGLAAIALFIPRPLVAIGGFFAIGGLAVLLARALGFGEGLTWLFFLVGGLVGAVLVFIFFDWALIINSSLSGAGAVAAGAATVVPALGGWIGTILLVVLAIVGITFQARDLTGATEGRRATR